MLQVYNTKRFRGSDNILMRVPELRVHEWQNVTVLMWVQEVG